MQRSVLKTAARNAVGRRDIGMRTGWMATRSLRPVVGMDEGYTAILCRRLSSPSTLRAAEACTLRRRPSMLPHVPVRRPPNSASACVPSLSSPSSGRTYARDFLRLAVPVTADSPSSVPFDEDDREERGKGSSWAAEAEAEERLDPVVVGAGTGSGFRIFL